MAAPPPAALTEDKLVVEPTFLIWTCPVKGRDSECQSFHIKNMTADSSVTFKIRGTKLDRFLVDPAVGIIDAQSIVKVDVQPKKIDSADGFNKMDCFNVLLAPLPPGEQPDVKEMWKKDGLADKGQLPFKLRVAVEVKDSA